MIAQAHGRVIVALLIAARLLLTTLARWLGRTLGAAGLATRFAGLARRPGLTRFPRWAIATWGPFAARGVFGPLGDRRGIYVRV